MLPRGNPYGSRYRLHLKNDIGEIRLARGTRIVPILEADGPAGKAPRDLPTAGAWGRITGSGGALGEQDLPGPPAST